MTDKLTRYLLARLPRRLAIGVMAFLLMLTFVAACVIFSVVTVVVIKSVIDCPPMAVVYFCILVFASALALVANHLAEKYPLRKAKDDSDATDENIMQKTHSVPPPLQNAGFSWNKRTIITYREDGDE